MAKLYFRHGAVGSAKSLNLIAVAHNYESQGKAVVIAKPAIDTRFGLNTVASRAPISKAATILLTDDTILTPELFTNIHCLVVDEAQFLSPKHIDMFRAIADHGCPVICYGLRTDYRQQLFPGSARLFELADSIEEVKTTCYFCNRKAIFNIKLVDGFATTSGDQVELGAEEKFLPTCGGHYREKIKEAEDHHAMVQSTSSSIVNSESSDVQSTPHNAQQPTTPVKATQSCLSNTYLSPRKELKDYIVASKLTVTQFRKAFNEINGLSDDSNTEDDITPANAKAQTSTSDSSLVQRLDFTD